MKNQSTNPIPQAESEFADVNPWSAPLRVAKAGLIFMAIVISLVVTFGKPVAQVPASPQECATENVAN